MFNQEWPVTLEQFIQAIKKLDEIFNSIIRHLPNGLSYSPDTTYMFEQPLLDLQSDARAALIMMERGRRFKKLVAELPEECLLSFIPKDEQYYGRHYFQHDILHYIDERQEHEQHSE